jgi:hypothetical protein
VAQLYQAAEMAETTEERQHSLAPCSQHKDLAAQHAPVLAPTHLQEVMVPAPVLALEQEELELEALGVQAEQEAQAEREELEEAQAVEEREAPAAQVAEPEARAVQEAELEAQEAELEEPEAELEELEEREVAPAAEEVVQAVEIADCLVVPQVESGPTGNPLATARTLVAATERSNSSVTASVPEVVVPAAVATRSLRHAI